MINLYHAMKIFVQVAETGSMTAAAGRLNCSKAVVSRYLSQLEGHLGLQLLKRTTRRVQMTEAGEEYFVHCRSMIEQNELVEGRLDHSALEPRGMLRISTSQTFGTRFVVPTIQRMKERYPEFNADIELTDRLVEIDEKVMDLAIRTSVSTPPGTSHQVLAEAKLILVASPGILKRYPMPKTVADLAKIPYLDYRHQVLLPPWVRDIPGNLNQAARLENGDSLVALACRGIGFAYVPDFSCAALLESGDLVQLLPGVVEQKLKIFAAFPQKVFIPLKSKIFIESLLQDLDKEKLIKTVAS